MLKRWAFVVRLRLATTNADLDELFCAQERYRTTEERDAAATVSLSSLSDSPRMDTSAPLSDGKTHHGHGDSAEGREKERETAFVFRLSFDGRNDDVPIVRRRAAAKKEAAAASDGDAQRFVYTTPRRAANFVYKIGATSVMELFDSFRHRYVTCQILVKRIARAEMEIVASASMTLLELLLATEPSFTFRLSPGERAADRSNTTAGSSSHMTSLNHTTLDSFLGSDDVLLVQKEKREHPAGAVALVHLSMEELTTIEMALKELVLENAVSLQDSAHGSSLLKECCVQYGPGWVMRSLCAEDQSPLRLSPGASSTAASSLNGSTCGGRSVCSQFTYNTTTMANQAALTTSWTTSTPSTDADGHTSMPLKVEHTTPVSITSTLAKFSDQFTLGFLLLSRTARVGPPSLAGTPLNSAEGHRARQTSESRCEERELAYFELPFRTVKHAMDRTSGTFRIPFRLHERKLEVAVREDGSGPRQRGSGLDDNKHAKPLILRGTVDLSQLPIFKTIAADLSSQEAYFREYAQGHAPGLPRVPARLQHTQDLLREHSELVTNGSPSPSKDDAKMEADALLHMSAASSSASTGSAAELQRQASGSSATSQEPLAARGLFTDDADGTGLPHTHSEAHEPSLTGSTSFRNTDPTCSEAHETTETRSTLPPEREAPDEDSPEFVRGVGARRCTSAFTPPQGQRASVTSSMPTPPVLPTPPKRKDEVVAEGTPIAPPGSESYTDTRDSSIIVSEHSTHPQSGGTASLAHRTTGESNEGSSVVTRRVVDTSSSASEESSIVDEEKTQARRTVVIRKVNLAEPSDTTSESDPDENQHRSSGPGRPRRVTVRVSSSQDSLTSSSLSSLSSLSSSSLSSSSSSSSSASIAVDSPSHLSVNVDATISASPSMNVAEAASGTSSVAYTPDFPSHPTSDPVLVDELEHALETMDTELSTSSPPPPPEPGAAAVALPAVVPTAESSTETSDSAVSASHDAGVPPAVGQAHAEAVLAALERLQKEKALVLDEMHHMGVDTRATVAAAAAHASPEAPDAAPVTQMAPPNRSSDALDAGVEPPRGWPQTHSSVAAEAPAPLQQTPLPECEPPTRMGQDSTGALQASSPLSTTGPSPSASPLPRLRAEDASDVAERPHPPLSKTPSRPSTAESYFRRSSIFQHVFNSSATGHSVEPAEPHAAAPRPLPPSAPADVPRRPSRSASPTVTRAASATAHRYCVEDQSGELTASTGNEGRLPPLDGSDRPSVRPPSRQRGDVCSALYHSAAREADTVTRQRSNSTSLTSPTFDIKIAEEGVKGATGFDTRGVLRPVPLSSGDGHTLFTGGTLRIAEEELFIAAIEKCDVRLVEHLVRHRPHVLHENNNLLHIACAVRVFHPVIVELLLRARPELARGVDTNTGCTALHCACDAAYHDCLNSEVVKVLLLYGVKAHKRNKAGLTAFHMATLFPFIEGGEPLHGMLSREAILTELFQVLDQLLVVGGSDVNERTSNGETPLHLVSAQCRHVGELPTVLAYLCSRGADVHATAAYMMPDCQHVRHLVPIEVSQLCGEGTTTALLANFMQQRPSQTAR
ncbi:proteophosphoglycan ppg4 [Strigomonas culicis]|uniref:Proteophosphoglycan ppg4 n=1 Tax=Strigomonas culicis TaxID=28005 RepID=S9V4M3_9TRYP|nr:proteophosphoglycan ppg4 [Strigomonas culicis]|eukprot:EPY17835.1 proteophosphoglycan ppg4 [Strigomonas culicis]